MTAEERRDRSAARRRPGEVGAGGHARPTGWGPPAAQNLARTPPALRFAGTTYPPPTDSADLTRKETRLVAGRPRTTVRKLTEIEEATFAAAESLWRLYPQYTDSQTEPAAGLDSLRREAVELLIHGAAALGALLFIAETRAGLDAEALERQREQRRGVRPLPAEGADQAGCGAGVPAENAQGPTT